MAAKWRIDDVGYRSIIVANVVVVTTVGEIPVRFTYVRPPDGRADYIVLTDQATGCSLAELGVQSREEARLYAELLERAREVHRNMLKRREERQLTKIRLKELREQSLPRVPKKQASRVRKMGSKPKQYKLL